MLKYIEIGGQKRPVRYNHNALEEFEELTGLSMLEDGIVDGLKKVKVQKALAFCGLKHGFLESTDYKGEVPFTLQDVGRWLDVTSSALIFQAYRNDTPQQGAESAEEAESKKSVGEISGA